MLNRVQRSAALIAVVSMLGVALAACGSSGGGTGTSATTSTGGAGGASTSATTSTGGAGTGATTAAGGATTAAGGATTAAGGGDAGYTAATCPDSTKGAKITMWSPLTGSDGNFMTAIAAQFTKSNNQGITVAHIPQPDYLQKMNTAAAGKSLPEMTVIRATDVAVMAARNVLQPYSADMLNTVGGDALKSDFPDQLWNVGQYKGKRYTIPLDTHPLVLYYNKDMFTKAGISAPPKTKDDFEKDIATLNQNGVMGIAIGNQFSAATLFESLVVQFGGSLSDPNGTMATYNSDAGVKALTYVRDMKKKYSPSIAGAGDPEFTAFQQGKAAMVLHGPWHISDAEKLPFADYAPMPTIGDKPAVWANSHQLGVFTTDPAKQAAVACWIDWLSKNSVHWAAAGQVPARNSVRSSTALATVAGPISKIAPEAANVVVTLPVPGLEDALWGTQFGPAVDAVVAGQQTDIKKALDDAAAKSNKIIKDNAQRYQ